VTPITVPIATDNTVANDAISKETWAPLEDAAEQVTSVDRLDPEQEVPEIPPMP
jgi:hypothetical protein